MTEERIAADFEGRWRLARRITPNKGPSARFEGEATWTRREGGFDYYEQGIMTLEGHPPMQAERRYFWADDLMVFFEDGRFFHQVPAAGGETRHWCDPDTYVVTYCFADWPRFDVTWEVSGPRKDYRSVTEYRRC